MNEIELVFPTKVHEIDAKEYFEEHILYGENTLHGDSGLDSAESYDKWLEKINDALTCEIHSIIFFAIRKRDKKLIGTINVRYPYLGYVQVHGHIGYGIRPSERRKGYATMMLKLALEHCRKIGLEKVLLTCDKSNLASAKTIMKCSGVFENEEKQNDGDYLQRYWIEL
jgi:predicted acetyltransferase